MTDYTDLIAFLNARLDEDEADARTAATYASGQWEYKYHTETVNDPGADPPWVADCWETYGDHIARHDPARVLVEVAAKRAIIDRYEFVGSHGPARDSERAMDMTTGAHAALLDVLKWIALPYADHPEYRDDWRPE